MTKGLSLVVRCLAPLGLAAGWLVASGMLVFLAFGYQTAFGTIRYGLHTFVPETVMGDALGIYQSRQAFIASAKLYDEPRPRLMYSGLSLDSSAYRFYSSSEVLRRAEKEIFNDYEQVQARLRALPQPEFDALLNADREFAVRWHSDSSLQHMLPFAIGLVLMALTALLHVGLFRRSLHT